LIKMSSDGFPDIVFGKFLL